MGPIDFEYSDLSILMISLRMGLGSGSNNLRDDRISVLFVGGKRQSFAGALGNKRKSYSIKMAFGFKKEEERRGEKKERSGEVSRGEDLKN